MFVPSCPVIPNTTVINKTIVYSDTVLPLKDIGGNLTVTSISGVDEDLLKKCLTIVFKSNPNVIFNTIQYSRNDKKVYFYTNKEISTQAYEDSKYINYNSPNINYTSKVKEEIENVLSSDKINDEDCISLLEVAKLTKKINQEYDSMIKNYNNKLSKTLENTEDFENSIISICGYDYKRGLLKIEFLKHYKYSFHDFESIYFAKKDNDLYIAKSEAILYDKQILFLVGSYLSELYDECTKYINYLNNSFAKNNINAINANFKVSISKFGVDIFVNDPIRFYNYLFKITSLAYDNEYKIDCNSNIINQLLKDNEEKLFNNIYVKISDCPIWSQEMLLQIRKNELEKNNKTSMKIKERVLSIFK